MIRKKKMFSRPRKAYESARIKEENELLKKFALKSKREVWKTQAKVDYYRRRAKELAKASSEEQEAFFAKLRALGLNANSTTDVLGMQVEDILNRRLPTIVAKKQLAKTPQHARQLVTHKKILIDGKAVNIPSYLVLVADENKITLKASKAKPKVEEAAPAAEGESQ